MPVTTTPDAAAAVEDPATSRRGVQQHAPGLLRVGLDFVSDWAVLCFASWTLVAYIGMLTEARVSLLTPLWLATTPFLAALLLFLRARGDRTAEKAALTDNAASPLPGNGAGEGRRTALLAIGLAAGAASAALAAWASKLSWPLIWLPALVAAVAVVVAGKLHSPGPAAAGEERDWRGDVLAAVVATGFAVLSLFLLRANADDVFYVNRATATGELNHIPVLDVIFTREEAARAGGAGLPVDSFSALQGALGRLVGVHPASVAYYLFPVVFTFLATWALWRLVRTWAPRRAWLCFALGSVFWLWSAQFPLTSGNYFLSRLWQGKVAFVAWLVPTLYVYLTRWLGKRDALVVVLLLAAGLCSIGMTGSATFVAPLIFLTALLPLLVRLDWPALAVPLAAAAIPFTIGMVVLLRFPLSETVGARPLQRELWFYQQVLGSGFVAAVAAFGVWAAPWIARPGPAQRVASGLAVVVTVLLAPGLLSLVSDVSGLTDTLRRLLWVVPVPAVVGLLAAFPVAARVGKLVPVGAAVATGALLVAFGNPLWIHWDTRNSLWHYPPAWKMRKIPEAQAILRRYKGDGPILATQGIMQAIAILTVEPKAVNARTLYLIRTREPADRIRDRLVLTRFIAREPPRPSPTGVRRALAKLDVGLVCVPTTRKELVPVVERSGPYEKAFQVMGEVCLERRA